MKKFPEKVKRRNDEYVATTLFGLEEVLAEELHVLGAKEIKIGGRAVYFEGDKEILYKANLYCRTAIKILKPIAQFDCPDEDILYNEVGKINWDQYMSVDETLSIDGVVFDSGINHSKYVALKTKDAICDQFRSKYDKRPSVDVRNPTLRLHVRISKDVCTISLNSSGESLHKRGYRPKAEIEAPISEVLAAGLIMLSGWDKRTTFIDPMCGSGTFLAEAALMAKNIPPGIFRKQFAFELWRDFDKRLWDSIVNESYLNRHRSLNIIIQGSDINPEAVAVARETMENIKVSHEIKIECIPLDQFIPPTGGGMVVFNPPYGERLNEDGVNALYETIGNRLKLKFPGYTAWLITSNPEAAKHIGLHPSKKITVYNGALECRFLRFELYEGSKKKKARVEQENEDE
ncbi:MAG: THUMP domain-containing protein [Bacteroidota bacterium]